VYKSVQNLVPDQRIPMILAPGWPGWFIEILGIIGPLTDPTAHGGSAEDVFDLVLPSIPGYGFSGQPKEVGWDPGRIAQAWTELIHRLGYTRYVAQARHRFLRAVGYAESVAPGRAFRLAGIALHSVQQLG
jgi:pimeloyl-ACP methyl ester carboxylesterase